MIHVWSINAYNTIQYSHALNCDVFLIYQLILRNLDVEEKRDERREGKIKRKRERRKSNFFLSFIPDARKAKRSFLFPYFEWHQMKMKIKSKLSFICWILKTNNYTIKNVGGPSEKGMIKKSSFIKIIVIIVRKIKMKSRIFFNIFLSFQ